ncbi:MAG: hypothetical protein M1814_004002 [Vezdaea aestivalis]|nr:MAG: hypothetical protein M1814_004002 [Vezdaea aestivalis]
MHLFRLLPTVLFPFLAQCQTTTFVPNSPSSRSFPSGIAIHNSCDSRNKGAIQTALVNLKEYVTAALGIAHSEDPLYQFFFRREDLFDVTTFFENASDLASGKGLCDDLFRSSRTTQIPGQTQIIVICPKFYEAPVLSKPCNKKSLESGHWGIGANQAVILLHNLIPIPYITGSENSTVIENQGNFVLFARVINTGEDPELQSDADKRERFQPRNNAYSYQFLASWAWPLERQRRQCRRAYPLWRILENPTLEKIRNTLPEMHFDSDRSSGELQKLLSAPSNEGLAIEEGNGVHVWDTLAEDNGDPDKGFAIPSNTILEDIYQRLQTS